MIRCLPFLNWIKSKNAKAYTTTSNAPVHRWGKSKQMSKWASKWEYQRREYCGRSVEWKQPEKKKKMFIESPTETRTSARAPLFCCCVCAKRVRFHSRDYKIEFRLYFIFQIQQPSALHRHITSSKTQRFSFESRARSSKKKTSSAHFEIVYLKQQHRQTQNSVEKRSNNNTIYVTSRVREMKKKNCLSDFTCVYKSLSWAELLFFLFVGVRCRCREDVDKQNWRIQLKRVRETSSICIHRNLIKLKPGNIAETSNRLANTQQPRKKNHSDQQQCDQAAKRLKV